MLLNKVIPLKYGYIGVKGRNQLEIKNKVHVSEAIRKEIEYFSKSPIYSVLPQDILGTRALIDKMSQILFNMIQAFLPSLKGEVSNRIRQAKAQLEALGEEFPDEEEKKLELVFKLVRKFKDNFDQAINGKYLHEKVERKKDLKNSDGETVTFQLNTQFSELFKKQANPEFRASADLKDEHIERAIETYQAASMPGFSSIDSFLALINPKLESLKDPIFQVLEECKVILETKGFEQLDQVFKKFPKLLAEVKDSFSKFLYQEKTITRRILENLVKSEENYLYTNDPSIIVTATIEKQVLTGRDIQVLEMRSKIDNYFGIVIKNLRDFVPKIIGQFLVKHFNANLEVEILNAISKRNYCLDSFNESEVSTSLRSKLRAELSALQKADNLLVSSFGLGYSVSRKSLVEEKASSRSSQKYEPAANNMEELDELEALYDEAIKLSENLAKRTTGDFQPKEYKTSSSILDKVPKSYERTDSEAGQHNHAHNDFRHT